MQGKLCRIYDYLRKDEQLKFDTDRNSYSKEVQKFMMKLKPITTENG